MRGLAFVAGLSLVLFTALGALKTVVVPRAVSSFITRALFVYLARLFDWLAALKRRTTVTDAAAEAHTDSHRQHGIDIGIW